MAGKKKPRLLNRFKLILIQKGGFSHMWIYERLVVGYHGYQMTFFIEDDFVRIAVFGSGLNFLLSVVDEFELYERCLQYRVFDLDWLKKMHGYYSDDIQRRLRAV